MASLTRLTQRIKENFQESTRDLGILNGAASSSSAAYFDTSEDKVKEISRLLDSRNDTERLEGMKRIVAAISKGRDMEMFYAQVVKNVVSPSIEIRKLVYIYLLRFASTNADLLLLSINTFQKDLSDSSPLIRSMSLRVLTSIRVPVIHGIVMLGMNKLVNDRNPWVRKTVAGGLSKVYDTDPSCLPQLIPLLNKLLSSPSAITLGPALSAFCEICPDRLDLLHPHYRHICRLLLDTDEWAQVVALSVLTRYARSMLEKPDNAGPVRPDSIVQPSKTQVNGEATDDEDDLGMDIDLAMLLHFALPLFQSRNAAVILATAATYYHLAPAGHAEVGQEKLVDPLLRLAGAQGAGAEASAIVWEVIAAMASERPWLFEAKQASFFLRVTDTPKIQQTKLSILTKLITPSTAEALLRELKQYVRFPLDAISATAIRAIGQCARAQPSVAQAGLTSLMRLLRSKRDSSVSTAVIVLKSVIQSNGTEAAPVKLVAKLARQLDAVTNDNARACVFWLVGQYAGDAVTEGSSGQGWEGMASWAPDVFRKGVKGFMSEAPITKLQLLTLATKLFVLSPATPQLTQLSQYLFMLARYDADFDVRDRGRFLHALLRGLRQTDGEVNEDEEDTGGVILRREQVKLVMLGAKGSVEDASYLASGSEFEVGTLSRVLGRRLQGYEALPEWTDDPSDSSLRDIEDQPIPTPAPAPSPATYSSRPSHLSAPVSTTASPIPASSPAGSTGRPAKPLYKDLEAFLDESSEEEDSEEEETEEEIPPLVVAPSRTVEEYDVGESEQSEDESEDEDDEDEDQPLTRDQRY